MIKVTISSTAVRNMAGKSKTTGKDYNFNTQDAWFHLFNREGVLNPFPEKVEIMLDRNDQGAALFYEVGEYLLHPSSIYLRDGKLVVAPRLHPVKKNA